MQKIIVILAIALLCSCKTTKPPIIAEKQVIKERTVTITELIHDTTVAVQSDSAMVAALLACDSTGNVYIKQLLQYQQGKHVQPPKLNIKDNVLSAKSLVDSFTIYLTFKERLKIDSTSNIKNEIKPVVIKENHLTGWQWFQIWCGRILISVLTITIGWKIAKSKIKWL